MKLLFASQNVGKVKEFKTLIESDDIKVVTPQEVGLAELDVEETGSSFEENALLKAKEFATRSGLITVADDSGLCLDAFNGFPGVKTNRWMEGTPKDKNLGLIDKLSNESDRSAKFVCSICLYDPKSKKNKFFDGEVKGQISQQLHGKDGFGYDPIFIPNGYDQTFAQMAPEEKNKISHRYKALEKLKKYLSN